MTTLYLVAGMAIVTFSIRYVLFPLSGRIIFSDNLKRALGYVPPAVLTAIIVPATLIPDGQTLSISWTNAYLVGAFITTLIGWLSKNLLITIVGGMAGFAFWQWLLTQWLS
ncbi:MAG: AzlD domain-containing protein [Desulfobacteraceae bacterium]|jgi:branched-subunit amino acid transport protein